MYSYLILSTSLSPLKVLSLQVFQNLLLCTLVNNRLTIRLTETLGFGVLCLHEY